MKNIRTGYLKYACGALLASTIAFSPLMASATTTATIPASTPATIAIAGQQIDNTASPAGFTIGTTPANARVPITAIQSFADYTIVASGASATTGITQAAVYVFSYPIEVTKKSALYGRALGTTTTALIRAIPYISNADGTSQTSVTYALTDAVKPATKEVTIYEPGANQGDLQVPMASTDLFKEGTYTVVYAAPANASASATTPTVWDSSDLAVEFENYTAIYTLNKATDAYGDNIAPYADQNFAGVLQNLDSIIDLTQTAGTGSSPEPDAAATNFTAITGIEATVLIEGSGLADNAVKKGIVLTQALDNGAALTFLNEKVLGDGTRDSLIALEAYGLAGAISNYTYATTGNDKTFWIESTLKTPVNSPAVKMDEGTEFNTTLNTYAIYYVVANQASESNFDTSNTLNTINNHTRIVYGTPPTVTVKDNLAEFKAQATASNVTEAELGLIKEAMAEGDGGPVVSLTRQYVAYPTVSLVATKVPSDALLTFVQTFVPTKELAAGIIKVEKLEITTDESTENEFSVATPIVRTAKGSVAAENQYWIAAANDPLVDVTGALAMGQKYNLYYTANVDTTDGAEITSNTRISYEGDALTDADTFPPSTDDNQVNRNIGMTGVTDMWDMDQDDYNKAQYATLTSGYATKYSPVTFEVNSLTDNGTATDGLTAVFNTNFIFKGETVAVSGNSIKLEKLYEEALSPTENAPRARPYTFRNDVPRPTDDFDGHFWVTTEADTSKPLGSDDMFVAGTEYTLFFAIKDTNIEIADGGFDADSNFKAISDPLSFSTGAGASSDDDSNSGCTVGSNPATDLMLLLLALMGMVGLRAIATRKNS